MRAPKDGGGFGKRGRVEVGSPADSPPLPAATNVPTHYKWIGGGLAAVAVLGLIGGGTGGGGLLGGLIGGLLGKHLADRSASRSMPQGATQTAKAPTPTAAPATSVQRGGFGTTASSGSGGFFSSGS